MNQWSLVNLLSLYKKARSYASWAIAKTQESFIRTNCYPEAPQCNGHKKHSWNYNIARNERKALRFFFFLK